jgi:hypothetical protein
MIGQHYKKEMFKVDINTSTQLFYPHIKKIWTNEKSPEERKRVVIIKLPKKGDTSNCNNWKLTLCTKQNTVKDIVK